MDFWLVLFFFWPLSFLDCYNKRQQRQLFLASHKAGVWRKKCLQFLPTFLKASTYHLRVPPSCLVQPSLFLRLDAKAVTAVFRSQLLSLEETQFSASQLLAWGWRSDCFNPQWYITWQEKKIQTWYTNQHESRITVLIDTNHAKSCMMILTI